MSQISVNPDELEQFANHLRQFVEEQNNMVSALSQRFSSLAETWRDEKRASFEETFEQLVAQLRRFEQETNEQIPYLMNLVAKARDYLGA